MLHKCTKPLKVWLQKQLISLCRLPEVSVLWKLASWVQCFGRAPSQLCSPCSLEDRDMWVALPDSAQVWQGTLPSPWRIWKHPCKVILVPALHPSAYWARVAPYPEYPTPSVTVANKVNDIYKVNPTSVHTSSKLFSDLFLHMFHPAFTLRNSFPKPVKVPLLAPILEAAEVSGYQKPCSCKSHAGTHKLDFFLPVLLELVKGFQCTTRTQALC